MALEGSVFSHLTGGGWVEETQRIKTVFTDSLAGRAKVLEVIVGNPANNRNSTYTTYQYVKLVDSITSLTIFYGRVEAHSPFYDDQYGQCIKVIARGLIQELFERKPTNTYASATRASLIGSIVQDYDSAVGAMSVEGSGSTDSNFNKDFSDNTNKTAIQIIEDLAQEDPWTDATWGAAWRWNGAAFDNDTAEANSSGGVAFDFLADTSDFFYLGQNNPFVGATFDLAVFGSYGAQDWEYWNGSAWTNLTITQSYAFTADGMIRWEVPSDWTAKALNDHAGPPDATSRYWARIAVASVTTTAVVFQITCEVGVGYDYYVGDTVGMAAFNYFRRGSLPAGGAAANGLTISLGEAESATNRAMLSDYSFSSDPKETITRVRVRGIHPSDGSIYDSIIDDSIAINTVLEAAYDIVKEKTEFVFGSENFASDADLESYCQNRATMLLNLQEGDINRGEVKITGFPYFNSGGYSLVHVGDNVHIHCTPQSINKDYIVMEIRYEEPMGISTLKLISHGGLGRGYSPLETTTILQDLREGKDVTFENMYAANATINKLSASKITTGTLQATTSIQTLGTIWAGTSLTEQRIQITADEIAGYNSANDKQFYIRSSDGKAAIRNSAGTDDVVVLDNSGIQVYGANGAEADRYIQFLVGATGYGWIYPDSTAPASLKIVANARPLFLYGTSILTTGTITPQGSDDIGASGNKFVNGYFSGTLYPDKIGPYANTADYITFRTQNIAGDTPIDHVFAPQDANYGYLGDSTYYWKRIYGVDLYTTNIYCRTNGGTIGTDSNYFGNLYSDSVNAQNIYRISGAGGSIGNATSYFSSIYTGTASVDNFRRLSSSIGGEIGTPTYYYTSIYSTNLYVNYIYSVADNSIGLQHDVIILNGKYLQLGNAYTAAGAETFQGYMIIKDNTGADRKVMVCA